MKIPEEAIIIPCFILGFFIVIWAAFWSFQAMWLLNFHNFPEDKAIHYRELGVKPCGKYGPTR
jgi:hypothetical protein